MEELLVSEGVLIHWLSLIKQKVIRTRKRSMFAGKSGSTLSEAECKSRGRMKRRGEGRGEGGKRKEKEEK